MAFENKVALAMMLEYVDRRSADLAVAWEGITESELEDQLDGDFMSKEMSAIHDFVSQALISDKPTSGASAYLKKFGINLSNIRKELIKQTQKHIQKSNNKR